LQFVLLVVDFDIKLKIPVTDFIHRLVKWGQRALRKPSSTEVRKLLFGNNN